MTGGVERVMNGYIRVPKVRIVYMCILLASKIAALKLISDVCDKRVFDTNKNS